MKNITDMENGKTSVLVTGASGFIGSFLVEGGLENGMVTWAGIRKSSSRRYLQDSRIQFIELDLSDPELLLNQLGTYKQLYGKWDYIIHCAGVTKCKNKEEFEKGNYLSTRNLIEALQILEMVPRQFVYLSSLSVFGPIHEECYTPIGEKDQPSPNTTYGFSKLQAEQYMQSLDGFPFVIFRPTGVYGPREKDYFLMAKSVKNHMDFSAGFKKQDLTFLYVKDLVKAVYLAISCGVVRKAYFVSDGNIYSSSAFARLIQKELRNKWVIHIKCPLFVLKVISLLAEVTASCFGKSSTLNTDKYKIMKQRNWQCDIAPLVEELGYQPEYDLEKGVKEMIAWYKKEAWL